MGAEVLAQTRGLRNPNCRCEEFGILTPDTPVSSLPRLGEGCNDPKYGSRPGWICERLDTVRRRFGQ